MNGAPTDGQKNVILITIDSLRADHCGFMGYDKKTTPALDAMAEDGYVFDAAIAPGPSTYESMPAVFTGNHMVSFRPELSGRATTNEATDGSRPDTLDDRTRNIRLNMNAQTIAEWFDRHGYVTGAFTTNPYTGVHTPFARGFDTFEDFLDGGEGPIMRKAAQFPVLSELKHIVTLLRSDRASKRWTEYYDQVTTWINQTSEPYFLWLFLLDTHTPYLPEAEYRSGVNRLEMYYHNWRLWAEKKWRNTQEISTLNREKLVALYDSTIRSVDQFIDRLWTDVQETNPAIVVHSDHGEAFGDHGIYGHESHLFEENIHVPLVVYNHELYGRDNRPVSLVHLPEILRSVATESPEFNTNLGDSVAISKNHDATRFSIRGNEWKYVCRTVPSRHRIVEEEMYDLEADPNETQPVSISEQMRAWCRCAIHRRLVHEREIKSIVSGIGDWDEIT